MGLGHVSNRRGELVGSRQSVTGLVAAPAWATREI